MYVAYLREMGINVFTASFKSTNWEVVNLIMLPSIVIRPQVLVSINCAVCDEVGRIGLLVVISHIDLGSVCRAGNSIVSDLR